MIFYGPHAAPPARVVRVMAGDPHAALVGNEMPRRGTPSVPEQRYLQPRPNAAGEVENHQRLWP